MNKMTVIQLLNKIANGEEVPERIKIKDEIWTYDYDIDYKASDDRGYLFEILIRTNYEDLNEEVEIIEEEKKIPKKINTIGSKWYSDYIKSYIDEEDKYNCYDELLMNKINEIIDYLKSKGE